MVLLFGWGRGFAVWAGAWFCCLGGGVVLLFGRGACFIFCRLGGGVFGFFAVCAETGVDSLIGLSG